MPDITLTAEQEQEFGTDLLKAFARSFIAFRRSSPYTTKRKLFRYFEPLPAEKLTEREILFGTNREKAYRELMHDFKACLAVGAFDALFGDKHYYWRSETVPGLVILRKWLEPEPDKDNKKEEQECLKAIIEDTG